MRPPLPASPSSCALNQSADPLPRSQGGDAHHSVLVKGLDHALLARKKHEAALEADAELDDVEDALDEAFDAQPAAPPLPASADEAGSAGAAKGKGKSRNELLAELKAMRGGAEGGAAAAGEAGKGQDSRFKPIGADRKGKSKEGAAGLGAGWKSVGAAGGDAGGEKKRRKKKKVVPGGDDSAATASAAAAAEAPTDPPPPPLQPAAPPPPPVDEFDDDADIFGDVGEYGGLGDDSDSDNEAGSAPRPPPPAAPPAGAAAASTSTSTKRKYFDDDDDDADKLDLSTAPSSVADLAAKQAAADAAALLAREHGAAGSDDEGAQSGDEPSRPTRLQGLSSSKGPSARDLLEMDKEAEAEDKRKAVGPSSLLSLSSVSVLRALCAHADALAPSRAEKAQAAREGRRARAHPDGRRPLEPRLSRDGGLPQEEEGGRRQGRG